MLTMSVSDANLFEAVKSVCGYLLKSQDTIVSLGLLKDAACGPVGLLPGFATWILPEC